MTPEEQKLRWRANSIRYRQRHPERAKEIHIRYRVKHVERLRKRTFDYYWSNPQQRRLAARASYKKHREKALAARRNYNRNHPDYSSRTHAARRARLAKAPQDGTASGEIRRVKLAKNLRCYYCSKPLPFGKRSVEHIVPISRGGANSASNMCAACSICNSKKQAKTLSEWVPEDGQKLLSL